MVHSILVGLDGSNYSAAAVELGIRWARRKGAVLLGLGIVDEPTIGKAEPTGIGGGYYKRHRDEQRIHDARQRIEQFLEHFTSACGQAGVACRALREVGLPSERLLCLAEDCDLLILGQCTYFHFETQTDADETLKTVLHGSRRPVVAVSPILPASRAVLIAYDASPGAVRALEAFQKSGLDHWHTVRVVSVAQDLEEATRRAEEAAAFLRFHDIPAEAQGVTSSGSPAELLLDKARELKAGMLVMGAFGHSRLSHAFFGSTTKTILRKEGDFILFLHH